MTDGPITIPETFNELSRLEQIQFYLDHSLLIHPCYGPNEKGCTDPGKSPRWTVPERLNNSAQERLEAFARRPSDNIGVVPRIPHIGLDIDDKNPDRRGLRAFELFHPNLFGDTLRCTTNQGWHFYLFCPDVPFGQDKITIQDYFPHLSIEIFVADHQNLVSPPSTHQSGVQYRYQGVRELELSWKGLLLSLKYQPQADSRTNKHSGHNGSDPKWKRKYRGNLSTLDIVALATELGLYGHETKEDRHGYLVHTCQCPWRDEHDNNRSEQWNERDSSAALLTAEGKMPVFNCLHNHCTERSLADFLEYAESQIPGIVDRHCSRSWQPRRSSEWKEEQDSRERGTEEPDGHYEAVDWSPVIIPAWAHPLIYPHDSILHPFVEYARSQSEAAECYLIGAILPVVARLLARNVHFRFGRARIFPNIFAILVGPPGDRKSFTIDIGEALAKELLPFSSFLPKNSSSEGIFDEYDEANDGCPDKIQINDDASNLLSTWRTTGYGERAADLYLSLYDCKGLSESFRRNRKETADKKSKRYISQTSTSLLFGATPLDAVFPQQKHQKGLGRRFLSYFGAEPSSVIPRPPLTDIDFLIPLFRPLLDFKGPIDFARESIPIWDQFQYDNRDRWKAVPEEREIEKYCLSAEPTHVLKVGMHFEACRAAFEGRAFFDSIRPDTMQLAIEHVQACLTAGTVIAGRGRRHETRQLAEEILGRIRNTFLPDTKRPETIYVSRGRLTRQFCHNAHRKGSLQVDTLYQEIIPYLSEKGDAKLIQQHGLREIYAFRAKEWVPPQFFSYESDRPDQPQKPGFDGQIPQKNAESPADSSNHTIDSPRENAADSSDSSDSSPPLSYNEKSVISQKTHFQDTRARTTAATSVGGANNIDITPFLFSKGEIDKIAQNREYERGGEESGESEESESFYEGKSASSNEESKGEPGVQMGKVAGKVVETTFFETPDFVYCADHGRAKTLIRELNANPSTCIALDLETYGPGKNGALFPHLGDIRLLSVNVPGSKPVTFDLKRIGYINHPWATLFEGRETIAHNVMFELKWVLDKLGFPLPRVFCTMHAARLLQMGIDGGLQHAGLASVVTRYLGRTISKDEQLSDFGAEYLTFAQVAYAIGDVQFLVLLRQQLHHLLDSAEGGSMLRVFARDMEHLIPLARRELLGIRFDVRLAHTMIASSNEEIERLEARLHALIGEIDLGSHVAIKRAFKERLGIDLASTAKTVMKPLANSCEAARLLREWRKVRALKVELGRLLEHVHPDGRIYPQLDSLGTETGRIVSSKPTINNMSVGTGARACILPDTDGDIIINPDFSREEPTIFAIEFGVRRLIDDINADRDIYEGFAAEIYAGDSVTPKEEQLATGKVHFLGIGYGEQAPALIRVAWEKDGRIMPSEEAQRIFDAHVACYPEIHGARRQARFAAARGKIRYGKSKLGRRRLLRPVRPQPTAAFVSRELTKAKKSFFGTVAAASYAERLAKAEDPPIGKSASAQVKNQARRLKIEAAREKWGRWEADIYPQTVKQIEIAWPAVERRRVNWEGQNLAINFRIQAGGSDVLRAVEIKLEERLPVPARVIFSNHDEAVVSCPRPMSHDVAEIIRATMCECLSADYPGVKVAAKVQTGDTWQ